MSDPATLLTSGAQRILDLLGNYFEGQRRRAGQQRELIDKFHAGLIAVDRDYQQIFGELENTLEDIAAEPDRAAAQREMRRATQRLRLARAAFDATRTDLRALVRNVMLVTDDPVTRTYFWAATAYLLDEDAGVGFPGNIPAAIQTLMARDIGALTRTPSSVVLLALENGSTPDQVLSVLRQRRAQMKLFLDHAVEVHGWMTARTLRS
jgi:hypothetical protein